MPLTAELPDDGRGPCLDCRVAAETAAPLLGVAAEGPGERSIFVGCACSGRRVQPVWQSTHGCHMVAASVAKLAWTLAAIRAHRAREVDLYALQCAADFGDTAFRDGVAALPPEASLPWASWVGLALVTSANPVFDHLSRIPGLRARANDLGVDTSVASGFSDTDLSGAVYGNRATAWAAAELLVAVSREATGGLEPIWWGLVNGSRTTRLVRDLEGRPSLRTGVLSANKTGTLTGVRNDVALLTDGDNALVVAFLAGGQADASADDAMAAEGAALADARYGVGSSSFN